MDRRSPIRYRVFPQSPHAHLFEVACTVADPDPQGQRFALPAWIPGSYLIRDYARHVVAIRAQSGRRPLPLGKLDKHTWVAAPCAGPLTVTMQVYAWDLSVRGAHLDTTHGFFNGCALFLRPIGHEQRPCEVDILRPAGARYRSWQLATSMPRKTAPAHGFGTYRAAGYDELIDHPVEMGRFSLASFSAGGVPHEIAITGRHDADLERLVRDLKRLCEWHLRLFAGRPPMSRYLFLVTALGEGYGGLEHRASTALLCARDDLPRARVSEATDAYRGFLGLCSHEYFHTWNVKRIKPAAFTPYDLDRENYTGLLWAFEGITSYYDDLALVRCGLISQQEYLELIGRSITSLLRTPGRGRQSVAEASFDAWIKYYRQDENSPNAQVSYYLKGSLIALCLDLTMRSRTRGRKSLDDLMRALWREYGARRPGGEERGVEEAGIERLAEAVSGLRLRGFFDRALRSTAELPLKSLLARAGIEMHLRAAESSADKGGRPATRSPARLAARATLGARTAEEPGGVKLTHVLDHSAAQSAGLAAGDILVAIDGLRVTQRNLDQRLAALRPGDRIQVHAFRRDELLRCVLVLAAPAADTCYLTAGGTAAQRRLRERWLAPG